MRQPVCGFGALSRSVSEHTQRFGLLTYTGLLSHACYNVNKASAELPWGNLNCRVCCAGNCMREGAAVRGVLGSNTLENEAGQSLTCRQTPAHRSGTCNPPSTRPMSLIADVMHSCRDVNFCTARLHATQVEAQPNLYRMYQQKPGGGGGGGGARSTGLVLSNSPVFPAYEF